MEVNFEKKKAAHSLFQSGLEPKTICEELSVMYDTPIIAGKTLVFLILDTGILQRLSGLNLAEILLEGDFSLVNKGSIAENFAGLELLKAASCFTEQQLYFWQRDKLNAHAEVDFLIQQGDKIVPIEVKSGTSGKMQSLHLFMKEKNIDKGIRCSVQNYNELSKFFNIFFARVD